MLLLQEGELALAVEAVPVVFNRVVGAPRQQLRDLRPAVADAAVSLQQHLLLLSGPRLLVDLWRQVILPALSALLANPAL